MNADLRHRININIARSLSAVSLHKVVQVAGLVATVVLVPRLFGAADYGRFAFVLSLSYLGQILGDFGTLDVMGKFVPGFLSKAAAARLYSQHLVFKLWVGLACGLITAAAALLLGSWMRLDWALLAGLGVWLHIVAWVPFQFSLGLKRVGLWMSEQAWRQWALLALLLVLLPPFGLTGALVAVVSMELLFVLLGLWAVRDYWHGGSLRFDWQYLQPYLRFGAGFFMANLAAVALYRSGPLLVETLTGQPEQTGYFNLALGLFLLAYVTTGQFAQSLLPALSEFYSQGRLEAMQQWLNNFVTTGWLLAWAGVISIWAVTDWAVPLVFGADFGPASAAFKWISLGLPPAVLLWAGNVTATVTGRGRLKFGASLAALVIFGTTAWGLAPAYGAAGAALGLGLAVVANVIVLTAALRPVLALNGRLLVGTSGAAGLCLAGLVWLGGWG